METFILRRPSEKLTTLGRWMDPWGNRLCFTLEDQIREIAGQPVSQWKVKNETAIPFGRYKIEFQNSPRFGEDTITLLNVPGFDFIRAHGGNSKDDTEGCIIVGNTQDVMAARVSGASRGALQGLKNWMRPHISNLWVTIKMEGS